MPVKMIIRQFTFKLPNQSAGKRSYFPVGTEGFLAIFWVASKALVPVEGFQGMGITLPKCNTFPAGNLFTLFDYFTMKFIIGRISDVLLLNRGVGRNVALISILARDADAFFEDQLTARHTDAVTKMNQFARSAGGQRGETPASRKSIGNKCSRSIVPPYFHPTNCERVSRSTIRPSDGWAWQVHRCPNCRADETLVQTLPNPPCWLTHKEDDADPNYLPGRKTYFAGYLF